MIFQLSSLNENIFKILTHYYHFCDDGVSDGSQIDLFHGQTNLVTEACSIEVDGEILNLLAENRFSY